MPTSPSRAARPGAADFQEQVALKFELFNSLFLTLPFETVYQTGVLLPLLSRSCEMGYEKRYSPSTILRRFRKEYLSDLSDAAFHNLLFQFIQYIERQVVLFDALEDAAFDHLHNPDGDGSVTRLWDRAAFRQRLPELLDRLQAFRLRVVLTAHPTQFYPGAVLGIINDLDEAVQNNEIGLVNRLLMQLGKTPFMKKKKPTPLDEAASLIWYLEHVFYGAIPLVMSRVASVIGGDVSLHKLAGLFQMGFWPGGDRDGNPYVEAGTTIEVAARLREAILRRYVEELRLLRRRLTFQNVAQRVQEVSNKLLATQTGPAKNGYKNKDTFLADLYVIRALLEDQHRGLFREQLDAFIAKVEVFGFYFASMDVRQDSRIHGAVLKQLFTHYQEAIVEGGLAAYEGLTESERMERLAQMKVPSGGGVDAATLTDPVHRDVLESLRAIRTIQARNGVEACHRYIISNCRSALNVIEVFALARLSGWRGRLPLDIVPLFETVDDLQEAPDVMRSLYQNPIYARHLKARGNRQPIMLGFSDGTKDGGFLMANWSIYRAKEALTAVSREHGITVTFFDGRGGPPARGGGNTHAFYASLGRHIEDQEIQITIQGQTITANFGTVNSAAYNIEQLLSAGVGNAVTDAEGGDLAPAQRALIDDLAKRSHQAYVALKEHPGFLKYLQELGPLDYYGMANIGSRPAKRKQTGALTLDALRAIPFVGTWHQMKQNVPGFYGFGAALRYYEKQGKLDQVQALYRESAFFRALVENSMMSLSKSFFPLTRHLARHAEFGVLWRMIHREYKDTLRLLLEVSGQEVLLASSPSGRASIRLREQIVLPLLTIQQYALEQIRTLREEGAREADLKVYHAMVLRSMYGIINAGRNSA